MTKDGIHPLIPTDKSYFTITKTDGNVLDASMFLGLADLGWDDSWKTYPQAYKTDGDNYLDLCLKLSGAVGINDLEKVGIQAGVVYPPRGTGSNQAHEVAVIGTLTSSQYPYDRKHATLAEVNIIRAVVLAFEIIGAIALVIATAVLVPLIWIGVDVGLYFGIPDERI